MMGSNSVRRWFFAVAQRSKRSQEGIEFWALIDGNWRSPLSITTSETYGIDAGFYLSVADMCILLCKW
jgi:hypothetical protein